MPSSQNTTKNPTADQLYEALTRKLKKASSNIAKRKLQSGEYVMHKGRVMPASVLEEAKAEHQGAIPLSSVNRKPVEPKPSAPLWIGWKGTGEWQGSRKSITAGLVQASIRRPMHVKGAALFRGKPQIENVHLENSRVDPKDGQLFAYDAKSGQMIPVISDGRTLIQRSRRVKGRQHTALQAARKAK